VRVLDGKRWTLSSIRRAVAWPDSFDHAEYIGERSRFARMIWWCGIVCVIQQDSCGGCCSGTRETKRPVTGSESPG